MSDPSAQHKLDGATFAYIGGGGQTAENEEETGNIENDVLYKRQRELEETLGSSSTSGVFVRSLEKALEFDDSSLSSDYTVYAMMANKQTKQIVAMVNR